eukprot:CAMPEP_0180148854 /NCGR_PEP_ID=MMETSP0986-20121125/20318_1 /TAXON_ID=697907 /ORGANISM="non described non described, Strain CCMP2293" /LENGTH=701 /DNA_ID=CAMNT_0022095111 /DNA_START=54 /DNA_END=2156 /DNA_ORIENTATION=+
MAGTQMISNARNAATFRAAGSARRRWVAASSLAGTILVAILSATLVHPSLAALGAQTAVGGASNLLHKSSNQHNKYKWKKKEGNGLDDGGETVAVVQNWGLLTLGRWDWDWTIEEEDAEKKEYSYDSNGLEMPEEEEEFAPFVEGELYPSNMAEYTGRGTGGKVQKFQGVGVITCTPGGGDIHATSKVGAVTVTGGRGKVTVVGGVGAVTVTGGDGDMYVVGGVGASTVSGGIGDVYVVGGVGATTVYGKGGKLHVTGGVGALSVFGEGGPVTAIAGVGALGIFGGSGVMTVMGGVAPMTIHAKSGHISAVGGTGAMTLTGADGEVKVVAGTGATTITADSGASSVYGSSGAATLTGGANDVTLFGNAGAGVATGVKGPPKISTWPKVREFCQKYGGDLVSIHTAEQAKQVADQCAEGTCYIGLHRTSPSDKWKWTDESDVDFIAWDGGAPPTEDTHVAMTSADGQGWSGHKLDGTPAVCRKTRLTADLPLFVTEVAGTWDDVRASCRKKGGDLVSIHQPDQALHVRAMCPGTECWIGLQRRFQESHDGIWEWGDGTETNYLPWAAGQPTSYDKDWNVVLNTLAVPLMSMQISVTEAHHRFGVCLRDDALNDGKWWMTEGEDTIVRPWGSALAPDGKNAVVTDAAGNKLFVMEVETGRMTVLAGQRMGGVEDARVRAGRQECVRGGLGEPPHPLGYVSRGR